VNFDRAFAIVVGVEGGYTSDPRDPGGETKYGISKRANPDLDIKNLTLDQAKARYRLKYWPAGADDWPWAEALLCFDTSVNGGNWTRWHSMYAGRETEEFIECYQAEHNLYLADLPTFPTFGRGWSRRLIKIALEANKPWASGT
jgi:lysozyme family protein